MRENSVREAVQTKFARLKHVSGKVNLSDILTKEDKYKAHYITLRDRLMPNLAITGKVRLCINICEIISIIPMYVDRCHHNYSPENISDVDSTYYDFYTIMYVVESKGGVVKPDDVYP